MVENYILDIGVERIEEGFVIFSDNTVAQILEIEPIGYDEMSDSEKKRVDLAYERWIESLDFPIQILSRKVNSDLIDVAQIFMNNLEYEIKKKDLQKELLKFYESFSAWFEKHIKTGREKNLYYIVVPYFSTKSLFDKKFLQKKTLSKVFDEVKVDLGERVKFLSSGIEKTGVKVKVLVEVEIRELYSSYYGFYLFNGKVGKYEKIQDLVKIWEVEK